MHNGKIPAGLRSAKPAHDRARNNQQTSRKPPTGWRIKTKAKLKALERQQAMPRLEPPGAAQAQRSRLRRLRGLFQGLSRKVQTAFRASTGPAKSKRNAKATARHGRNGQKQRVRSAFARAGTDRQPVRNQNSRSDQRKQRLAKLKTRGARMRQPPSAATLAREKRLRQYRANSRDITAPRKGTAPSRSRLQGRARTAHQQAARSTASRSSRSHTASASRTPAPRSQPARQPPARSQSQPARPSASKTFNRSR